MFDYATVFVNENETIAKPEDFEITDNIYNRFSAFVKEKDFEYESESKHLLEDLIKKAKTEKYYEFAEADFEAIKTKLEPQLEKDLQVFSSEIKSLLKNEIVSRYYYQKGAIRASLAEDKTISEAIEKTGSPLAYNSFFEPGKIITSKDK